MASHEQRREAARGAVNYICSRSAEEMAMPVPNCPGWTVYNAAVHIGRVGIAWHSMINAAPDDPESRTRGYADAESRGSGHDPKVLASWALDAIDALDDDVSRPSYFSMIGGSGTVGLWAWHAASELGIHRLDVEDAVGDTYAMSDDLAIDALEYSAQYFLPAMARATDSSLDGVDIMASRDGIVRHQCGVRSPGATTSASVTTITGAPVDLLLALWGRPHDPIDISGSRDVLDAWVRVPGAAFQFGTWD